MYTIVDQWILSCGKIGRIWEMKIRCHERERHKLSSMVRHSIVPPEDKNLRRYEEHWPENGGRSPHRPPILTEYNILQMWQFIQLCWKSPRLSSCLIKVNKLHWEISTEEHWVAGNWLNNSDISNFLRNGLWWWGQGDSLIGHCSTAGDPSCLCFSIV